MTDQTMTALRQLYDILREITDDGVVDLDELRAGGNGVLADQITLALTLGGEVLGGTDPRTVK